MKIARVGQVMTLASLGLGLVLGLAGCSAVGLPNVGVRLEGAPASPAVLDTFETTPAVTGPDDWESTRAPLLRAAFAHHVYGAFPQAKQVAILKRTTLRLDIDKLAMAEQWQVQIGAPADDMRFSMVVLKPESTRPVPMLVMQNFCGNAQALKNAAGVDPPRHGGPKECSGSILSPVVPLIFGSAIMHPPLERILGAGYGVALLYAGDIVPDEPVEAGKILARLTPKGTAPAQQTGAIAAWAWTYLRATDALESDADIDKGRIVLWGHSRNGKSALLAASMDSRPQAVIALQAGTAGGSLGRDAIGESIAEITTTYPHWFAPEYATWATRQSELPVDQHQLLALIAPRPVLLGSGRRDRWSDPHGAVRAAAGASPVYELYGSTRFAQTDLRKPDFGPQLVTYMRAGLHGIHTEDWDAALAFLKAKAQPAPN
jgi:hypothetical protein